MYSLKIDDYTTFLCRNLPLGLGEILAKKRESLFFLWEILAKKRVT